MAIKRGVSSYSYQNLIFDRKMDWKGFIRTVHDELHTDGIELIDETFIREYPFISEQFVYDWNNEMARYGMKAVTMDVYLDVLQFRDHIMTHAEAAERLKRDLVIASKLGFENVRCLATVPMDVIEACLETAEKVNVRIGQEVHAPLQINFDAKTNRNPPGVVDAELVDHMIEMIQRTGTKHAGLVPDMGLFQNQLAPTMIAAAKRSSGCPEAVDFIMENRATMEFEGLMAKVKEKYPKVNPMAVGRIARPQGSAEPVELLKVIPYTVSIHGKFYEMLEDQNNPGHYYDPSIDYVEVFKYLKQGCFNGYINSEFEGQGNTNDLPDEEMFDEREQVARHHKMMMELGAI